MHFHYNCSIIPFSKNNYLLKIVNDLKNKNYIDPLWIIIFFANIIVNNKYVNI